MTGYREALLLLGGDLGDVRSTMEHAQEAIAKDVGPVLAVGRAHWTEPWGFAGEKLFLNKAISVRTALEPTDLLRTLLRIEERLGRVRGTSKGYSSRTLDIDILLIGDSVVDLPELRVPHPLFHQRRFALAPAADVAPLAVHPILQRTVLQLLNDLGTKA
jgi:2-amino-4-hydroxy-6-hydroxymethyldihydropteridine diphosphokinase